MNADHREHTQAQNALQESKERFRGFAEATFEGIGIADGGIIIETNQQLARMLGYEVDELIGMAVTACVAPASRALVRQRSEAESDKPYQHLALRKDGTPFPVEVRGKTITYQGRTVRVAAIRDITARIEAEEALRKSEECFSKIFYASPVAIALSSIDDGRIIDVNGRFLHLFGFSRDEVVGRPALEIGIWEDEQVRQQIVASLEQQQNIRDFEVQFATKSGARCDMRGAVEKIELGGRLCLLWMGVDITERKRAEEALRHERAFLNSIVENIPTTVFVKDAQDLRYVRINKAGEELVGYSQEELLGKTDDDVFLKEEADFFRTKDREVLARGEMVDIPEEPIHTHHHGTRLVHTRKIPILDEQGRPQYLLGISEDITEHKRYEEELVAAKEEAEEMNCLKSAFLANMSHEIRTPLAGIIGFSEILALEVPDAQRKYVRLIELSGRRLLDTLNAVLDLSMLEAGGLKLNRVRLNVAEEVQKKADVWRLDAQAKGLHLELLLSLADVEALLDQAALDRILHHLVGNAIKFTEQGEITVAVMAVDDRVEIEIRDTGIGIDAEFLPRLFEAFKQESTGTGRTYEGTGLGLTLARRLVDLMGGTLTVESQKGSGSIFTVSFPRCMLPEQARQEKQGREPCPPVERLPVRGRVLAVDDNAPMLHLLERFMEEIPEVSAFDTAKDDEAALTLARKHHYDVVLMDINLGGTRTGEDVLHDLRSMPDYATTPIVAVTAYAMPEDRSRFLEAGFDAYLGKPFTEEQLRTMLTQMLPTLAESGS